MDDADIKLPARKGLEAQHWDEPGRSWKWYAGQLSVEAVSALKLQRHSHCGAILVVVA